MLSELGFVRVAVGIPRVFVGNPRANVDELLSLVRRAAENQAEILLFPELALTGYSCGDLFGQEWLVTSTEDEIKRLASESASLFSGLVVVGAPFRQGDLLHNAAFAISQGKLRNIAIKRYLPTYREFYEQRYFHFLDRVGELLTSNDPFFDGVPWGSGTVLVSADNPGLSIAIEICEDLWVPNPPSSHAALNGANVLLNLSASNELVGKSEYRRDLVVGQSARCMAAYVYAGAGVHESTQDLVYGGHALIAENGILLAENKRFQREPELIVADVDVERLSGDRRRTNSFAECVRTAANTSIIEIDVPRSTKTQLMRTVDAFPFVPNNPATRDDRCEEIFHIQTAGLAKRVESAGIKTLNIGVSGGLDSTLALLVAVRTCDLLGLPRSAVRGLTMPGFGTSVRTLHNAERLMSLLDVPAEKIDIRPLCMDTFVALHHKPFGRDPVGKSAQEFQRELDELHAEHRHDLTFENIQARLRTFLLMSRGFVVGTGDLSELALGWCTYNGDHMSMYAVNIGVPKTLVRFLVHWVADHEFSGEVQAVLHSIADTEISPELLPLGRDAQLQKTEDAIGPYELHDFFLYYLVRFGFRPAKIAFLARQAVFSRTYSAEEIQRWLKVFLTRFFANQFKRSCIPDGPKVGSVCLSPRGDWRMPSDADARLWLDDLELGMP